MTKKKQLKELERRIIALETKVSSLFNAPFKQPKSTTEEPTYEEVIHEWLNGKPNSERK